MCKRISTLVLVMLLAVAQLGYCGSNNWGNTDTEPLLRKVLPSYLVAVGTDVAGASTTVASGTSVIPVTGYSYVVKTISESVGYVCTVANGVKGQILVIEAGTVTGSDTAVITPATKTGFSTVTLATAKQSVTLLYLNDSLGWIILGTVGNPTVA